MHKYIDVKKVDGKIIFEYEFNNEPEFFHFDIDTFTHDKLAYALGAKMKLSADDIVLTEKFNQIKTAVTK